MKKTVLILLSALLLNASQSQAQSLMDMAGGLLNEINKNANPGRNNNTNVGGGLGAGLTNVQITDGLKEALVQGVQFAGGTLSQRNGFFGDALVKIVMPPEARKVESALRSFGFSRLADQLILSMNRAAEDAATKAVPIFLDAIRTISIQDGLAILRGGSNAATDFLRQRTTTSLANAFRPVIQQSLGKVDATKYWNDVFSTYNRLPLGQKAVNTDLTGYVTEEALKGLFTKIGQEEMKIRKNPLSQGSDLLRKVFGGR